VEIVKAAIDAYNREDWDAFFKDMAPGFELDFSRSIGPWRGVFGLDQPGDSWGNSARRGNPLGGSPTNSSKPVIS
jgi:hypothetical protein